MSRESSIQKQVKSWITLAILFISLPLAGQSPQTPDSAEKANDWVLGLSMTATGYYGDLNYNEEGILNSNFFSFYPGFNLSFRSGAPRRLNLQFELGYGKIVGQNPDIPAVKFDLGDGFPPLIIQPNRYTETFMVHNNLGFRINLIRQPKRLKPFLGVGFGILAFFPQSETGIPLVRKVSTRAPSEDIYNTITYQMPLTVGIEYNLDDRLGLHFSYTYRKTGTDYIDNIGHLGGFEGNDQLHVLQLGASIHFINRPERPGPRSRNQTTTHTLFSHQLEDPLPTQTPNPTAIVPGLKQSMQGMPNIYSGEEINNCDSLNSLLDSLQWALETEKVKEEAEAAGWKRQAYALLGEMVDTQKERDSLINLHEQSIRLQAENEAFKAQLKELKEGTSDYADQLSYEAMKAENSYLIQEVERLQQALRLKRVGATVDSNKVETGALIAENDWLAKELARSRKMLISPSQAVQMDTLRIIDSLLLSGQKDGIFVDISGFRIAMIVKGKNPMDTLKKRMNALGFRGYPEDGSWVYDYVKVTEIGNTTYRIFFDTETAESGFYQLTAFFQPEIGRVSISRYMVESRKAREWVVGMIK